MQARRISFRPVLCGLLLAAGILLHVKSPFEPGLTRAFQIDLALFSVVVVVASALSIRKQHQDLRGVNWWSLDALMVLVQRVFPSPVAHIVQLELAVWGSMWRLISRRGKVQEHELTYHRHSSVAGLVLLTVVTAPAEILLFELLIPWSWLRLVMLGLALYGACWLVGMVAAPRAFPHEMLPGGLVLRSGATTRWFIPRSAIARIDHTPQTYVLKRQRTTTVIEPGRVSLVVDGRTNIHITLRHGLTIDGHDAVHDIHCHVDEPEKLIGFHTPGYREHHRTEREST
jgi:hypothetical protein